ncbi:MAG: ketoacyl-ACP synthase III [Phycisphaerae bacterium]|nr:ketoacyl-ACP synthase III [Phycisphaerae bacterium]
MANFKNGQLLNSKYRAVLTGTGSFLPEKVLSNLDLEKLVDTSDEWIQTRTGIKNRRIADDDQTTATLAIEASKRALEAANIDAADLDMIICATITPEMTFPSTACFVQEGIGAIGCCAFDLQAACSGFTYGISVATSMISSGMAKNILVIGVETLSRITSYQDRGSCILFGDGAGAAVFTAEETTENGVVYCDCGADGSGAETLICRAYGSRHPVGKELPNPDMIYMEINGRETYNVATRQIVKSVKEALKTLNVTIDDVDLVIPHQMNARIMEAVVKRLKMPEEKMFSNIANYGNTSAASIAIALDEAVRQGDIEKGDLVVLVAFGGGLTWGVNAFRY